MADYSSIFRNSFPWFATLGFFLAFAESSGFGLITIFLTSSTVLILLPVVVSRLKPTSNELEEKSVSVLSEEVSSEPSVQEQAEMTEINGHANSFVLSSSDAMSDSESHEHTSSSEEYSENEWLFRENKSDSSTFSDGSISDEESLIEIALPNRQYLDSKSNNGCQQKWSLESHFRQQTWMEMLNDMNEDNFIEIDLCMGSIKCSRFEIEA